MNTLIKLYQYDLYHYPREAKIIAGEWNTHSQPVAAPRKTAMLVSYDDLWAQQLDPHARGWHYWTLVQTMHRALTNHGVGVDVIRRGSDLAQYDCVIAVAPMLVDQTEAVQWHEFVQRGGTLICTPRAFTKRPDNRTTDQVFPAGLSDLFGASVSEWTALAPDAPWAVSFNQDSNISAPMWAEVLEPTLANPLAQWQGSYAHGQAAITACNYGKGTSVLIGCYPTEEILAELLPRLIPEAALLPNHVERIQLTDGVLWLNHSEHVTSIKLRGTWRDKLTGETFEQMCDLGGLAVRWLVEK